MSGAPTRLGVLIIGQTPRPDLMAPLERLAERCELAVRGALDGVGRAEIPPEPEGDYPLVTRLRDGTAVTVDERLLAPRLQAAIDGLEREGVAATLLLCAGPFSGLVASRPLIRPFALAARVLARLGLRRVGVLVPTDDQVALARRKWTGAGFDPAVLSVEGRPAEAPEAGWLIERTRALPEVSALVLDYVGYPVALIERLREGVPIPVIDLGDLAVTVAEALMAEGR